MTQEEKLTLLKDLCARLPYGVKINHQGYIQELTVIVLEDIIYSGHEVKPYLRPMRSITPEEKEDIKPLFLQVWTDDNKRLLVIMQNKMVEYLNYLYSHHFDFCNLISKGLALEAPSNMYNIK